VGEVSHRPVRERTELDRVRPSGVDIFVTMILGGILLLLADAALYVFWY
jgi:hypothetical protein